MCIYIHVYVYIYTSMYIYICKYILQVLERGRCHKLWEKVRLSDGAVGSSKRARALYQRPVTSSGRVLVESRGGRYLRPYVWKVGPDTGRRRLAATRGYNLQLIETTLRTFHAERRVISPALKAAARGGRHRYGVTPWTLRQLQDAGTKRFGLSVDKNNEFRSRCDDDDCFYYHSWRNNVVIAFGTLSSFLT